jgi:hypothetical protein
MATRAKSAVSDRGYSFLDPRLAAAATALRYEAIPIDGD